MITLTWAEVAGYGLLILLVGLVLPYVAGWTIGWGTYAVRVVWRIVWVGCGVLGACWLLLWFTRNI